MEWSLRLLQICMWIVRLSGLGLLKAIPQFTEGTAGMVQGETHLVMS